MCNPAPPHVCEEHAWNAELPCPNGSHGAHRTDASRCGGFAVISDFSVPVDAVRTGGSAWRNSASA
eukprot:4507654-Alexandrium_andersonii.AAC.1